MSDELEAVGALGTAGLAATQLPGAGGVAPSAAAHPPSASAGAAQAEAGEHAQAHCRNCGATLTGAYCQACGQRAHLHNSLWHIAEEVLHGVSHFDAKGWRTLPLLVARPGLLTRRYLDGQRTRYVSPLALFLFTVFAMFLVFSYTTGTVDDAMQASAEASAQHAAEVQEALQQAQAKVAKARAEKEAAKEDSSELKAAEEALKEALAERHEAEVEAKNAARAASGVSAAASSSAGPNGVRTGGWRADLRAAKVDSGSPKIDQAVRRAIDNPDLTLYKLKNTAYKFSFMLVPISLPFLWLMFFWRRGVTMFDHAVFVLYSLSFMSLLFMAAALLSAAHGSGLATWAVLLVPPLHMAAHLRGTYGLSMFSTLWRTGVLLGVAFTVFLLFMLFIIVVTMS